MAVMISWDCSLITRHCWLLDLSRITSSWRASSCSLQSLCLWRVDVRKFVQPADPNGFVSFDLRQNWQSIAPFSKRNHVLSSNQHVWNDHAFVLFLSHPHLPLPFLWFVLHWLNYIRYHFVKGLLERSFCGSEKLSSVRTRFRDGSVIFWKKSPLSC